MWFDISTPDAPRARRFYQEMFGWPVNVLDETYAFVGDEDGQPTGGIGQAGPDSPYTGIVAYFQVDDVDGALARALIRTRLKRMQYRPCLLDGFLASTMLGLQPLL